MSSGLPFIKWHVNAKQVFRNQLDTAVSKETFKHYTIAVELRTLKLKLKLTRLMYTNEKNVFNK